LHDSKSAERVLESAVGRARINEVGRAELPNASEALKSGTVYDPPFEHVKVDILVNGIRVRLVRPK